MNMRTQPDTHGGLCLEVKEISYLAEVACSLVPPPQCSQAAHKQTHSGNTLLLLHCAYMLYHCT